MKFGAVPLDQALGGIVAHAVKQGDIVLKKGTEVTAAHLALLRAAKIHELTVARLEPGDMTEDAAAERLAGVLAGDGVRVDRPFTGRANIFADAAGVLVVDGAAVDRINGVDEAVTVATLPHLRAVAAGEMIGTVKIIPFAVPGPVVARALSHAKAGAVIRVAPFRPKKIAVISTVLPGLKASVIDKTLRVLEDRLNPAGAEIIQDVRIAHEDSLLSKELQKQAAHGAEIIIVFGASAITDRRDVIPAALELAGGRIEHLGMPVDPGNLLLLGELDGRPVIGAPGCARSPKENGFDWVLQRLMADMAVTKADIQAMGVGGLLMEIVTRPQPRAPGLVNHAQVAALVLAAGQSTRMGSNKLLKMVRGKPLVRHAAEAALASRAGPVFVVLGHQAADVSRALVGLNVTFVHNPDYAQGLSTSLKTGIAAVPETSAGALVLLGDMPRITPEIINRLVIGLDTNGMVAAVVPTVAGQRGNPILLGRALFSQVEHLSGDIGARRLIDRSADTIVEIPIDDAAVLFDVDTPDALKALEALG